MSWVAKRTLSPVQPRGRHLIKRYIGHAGDVGKYMEELVIYRPELALDVAK